MPLQKSKSELRETMRLKKKHGKKKPKPWAKKK
jgi:hypothetical protein